MSSKDQYRILCKHSKENDYKFFYSIKSIPLTESVGTDDVKMALQVKFNDTFNKYGCPVFYGKKAVDDFKYSLELLFPEMDFKIETYQNYIDTLNPSDKDFRDKLILALLGSNIEFDGGSDLFIAVDGIMSIRNGNIITK